MTDEPKTFKDKKLISGELKELGIEPVHFDAFYDKLKENKELPPEEDIPENQYKTIIDYLQQKDVLDKDGNIQEEGLKIFDSTKSLEDRFNELIEGADPMDPIEDIEPTGGVLPCRRERYSRSNGGVLPCR